ncbi:DUF6445 family protein [Roseateles sp. NT4]|uniref:DUF6445 family protein n=1 Tax=Roseateles sp. NT4 TaxID=3453715 RepID=UPI003EF04C99
MLQPPHHLETKTFSPALQINRAARLETVVLEGGAKVFVIDDFAQDPDALVELAREMAGRFQAVPGHPYPGPQLGLPDDASSELRNFFEQQMRARLGVRTLLGMFARFGRVTQEAMTLDARQRVCHRDDAGVPAGEMVAACVHYLFRDETLGGTVFFRSSMSRDNTAMFWRDANTLAPAVFGEKYEIPQGYMTQSNRLFEVIGRVPAKWNRAVFYDGGIFHSGDIGRAPPAAYREDPGRLTVNAFFRGLRHVA